MELEQIRFRFGEEVYERLKGDVEYKESRGWVWKIEVLDESEYFAHIAFVTEYAANIYEVRKRTLRISDQNYIPFSHCEKTLELMKSLEAIKR